MHTVAYLLSDIVNVALMLDNYNKLGVPSTVATNPDLPAKFLLPGQNARVTEKTRAGNMRRSSRWKAGNT